MKSNIDILVEISRQLGRDKNLVLAGGGNTSFKDGNTLWVKASGWELANITPEGFVPLDRRVISRLQEKRYPEERDKREKEVRRDLIKAKKDPSSPQVPSVETYFHEVIDYPWVVHLHPWKINTLTCSREGRRKYPQVLDENVLWIDFYTPGLELSRVIEEVIRGLSRVPDTILLQNHGVIIGGEEPDKVMERIRDIISRIEHFLPLAIEEDMGEDSPPDEIVDFLNTFWNWNEKNIFFLRCRDIPLELSQSFFTPDHIVYYGRYPLWLDGEKELERGFGKYIREREGYPRVIAINGKGVLGIGDNSRMAKNSAELFLDAVKIYRGTFSFGGPQFLKDEDVEFIDSWEAERYRRKVMEGKI